MASLLTLWSIVFWVNLGISQGLMCYECTSNDPLSKCVTNNGPTKACPFRYCMLYRIESDDGNPPFSLIRSCSNISLPPNMTRNNDIESHESKYYFRYCNTDFCNGGDGTSSKNPQRILVVNGKDNSAVNFSPVKIYLLVIPSLYLMFI